MLSLRHLNLAYDNIPILRGINLDVAQGEIVCLLGKSGSGKTTILRIVAGLESQYTGDVLFDGAPLQQIPVHERGFGLMFQDFALFPHMTVAQNVTFGLKMQRSTADYQQQRLNELLELVGLAQYAERAVTQLSGGEQQRVALARSLAPEPRLLMLDEPLGALDAGLRQRLVVDLRNIIKQIGLTALYVTHDQEEAYVIADRIAIMNAGHIEQIDTPQALYYRPHSEFVARFLGLTNIINRETVLNWRLQPPANAATYLIHPSGIALGDHGQQAIVESVTFKGEQNSVQARIDDIVLSFNTSSTHPLRQGDVINLKIAPSAIVPLANRALSD